MHWEHLTGNPRQCASIRALRFDDGVEGEQRVSILSTGGGLELWVLPDRGMDIGPLFWRGQPMAWEHPNGLIPPTRHDPACDAGTGIERALSGFLVTCGLDQVRHSQEGAPLHGRHTLTPARITRQVELFDAEEPMLVCEGEWTSAHLSGHAYRMQRRISAPISGNRLTLEDRIVNIGLQPAPVDLLYHFNLGFPAVQGDMQLCIADTELDLRAFAGEPDPAASPVIHCQHLVGRRGERGEGTATTAGEISGGGSDRSDRRDTTVNINGGVKTSEAECSDEGGDSINGAGDRNHRDEEVVHRPSSTLTRFRRNPCDDWPGIELQLISDSAQLPCLQVWQDPRPGRRILAIEPASSARTAAGESEQPVQTLQPGEERRVHLHWAFADLK